MAEVNPRVLDMVLRGMGRNSAVTNDAIRQKAAAIDSMTIHGNPKPVTALVEPLQVARDNGAKPALISIDDKRRFLEVDADIVEQVDPISYSDPVVAARKAFSIV